MSIILLGGESLIRKILRGLLTAAGVTIGYLIASELLTVDVIRETLNLRNNYLTGVLSSLAVGLLFGIIFFLLSPTIVKGIVKVIDSFERYFQRISVSDIIMGVIGAIIGMILGVLIGIPIYSKSVLLGIVGTIIILIFAIIGADVAVKKKEELFAFMANAKKNGLVKEKKEKNHSRSIPKVLDTSVIIDGRIFDICQSGFVEGPLVIPHFVLNELRHISDSSDDLKRTKGRRGLDILNKIQKELPIEVQVYEKDFTDIQEVDSKLLKLAQILNGKVVTNDYNLNKVAEVQGVPVLNINELSNAVKPVLLPGEELNIQIIKEGKEQGQGVAYLEDGTMIVVENGRNRVGEQVFVKVTSVLQTAAGRMIFATVKS